MDMKTLESHVLRKRARVVRRGAGGKGLSTQYLACGLPDWLIGFIGPKAEMQEIKQQLEIFLREELHLELSKTKTLITHARSQAARFLGYEVTTLQENAKRTKSATRGTRCRSINGRIGLRIPAEVLKEKCNRYKKNQKIKQRPERENDSDFTIMGLYQME